VRSRFAKSRSLGGTARCTKSKRSTTGVERGAADPALEMVAHARRVIASGDVTENSRRPSGARRPCCHVLRHGGGCRDLEKPDPR